MSKRDYPFRKSDEKFGVNLLSSLMTLPLAMLYSLPEDSNKQEGVESAGEIILNVKKEKTKSRICAIGAIMCPILGVLLYLFCDWYLPACILVFGVVQLCFYLRFVMFDNKIEKVFVFNRDDVDCQIAFCKETKAKARALPIVLSILSLYPIVLIILPEFVPRHIHLIGDIYLNFHWFYDPDEGLCLALFAFLMWTPFIILAFASNKETNETLLNNLSIKKILEEQKMVTIDVLSELIDKADASYIIPVNGCSLKFVIRDDFLQSRFELDRCGIKTQYIFKTYVSSMSIMMNTGAEVLRRIQQDIAKDILSQFLINTTQKR